MKWRWRWAAGMVVLVAALVAANWGAARSTALVDLSADRRFSLSAESREIARAVAAPLQVTAFVFERGGVARDATFLLDRYHEINDRIEFDVVDPDERPSEAIRYGITGYSTVVVEYEGRRVDARELSEVEISSAILRVLRGETRPLCFVTGHGEAGLDDDTGFGLSRMVDVLGTNAYDVREIDLTTGGTITDCDVVAVVGPQVELTPAELRDIDEFADDGGRVLVLGNPFPLTEADLGPLLEPWGIELSPGLVVDPDGSVRFQPDRLVVQRFPTANPIVRGVPGIELPASGALRVTDDPAVGLTATALAVTTDASFIDAGFDFEFTPGDDLRGPWAVAAAADASRVVRGAGTGSDEIVRTRVVAVASAQWILNENLDTLGNRRFLLNALAWLSDDSEVLTVAAAPPGPRPLPWTTARERQTVLVSVVAVPAGVLGLGLIRWRVSRARQRR